MAQALSDANFQAEVLDFEGIVLIDFWAEWCGPCKALGPIIDSLTAKYADNAQVKIFKLDVDENPATQSKYQVMSIPTLIFFKKGEVANTLVGLRSEDDLEAEINTMLT